MESRDLAHEGYPFFQPCAKRTTLHLDPSSFVRRMDDSHVISTPSSPSSAATQSPVTPLVPLISTHLPSKELNVIQEPASGPQRVRSSLLSSNKADKEKRKRSRVTPEQLVHLERLFSLDRSPTAARRREISELLGMQERQTQIWFQNRRAKAKLLDGKHKTRSGSTETSPDTPPELSTGFEVDLHNLIHEDEPVTIIPCTDLSIGTWRRIATTVGKNDLIAYVCGPKRCVTWFIHSAGYGFKMEIPFETILETEFTNAAPGAGLASFVLSQPPIFYLEMISSPHSDGSVLREWTRCADWTEGHQATKVLRHDLVGSAVQLAHLLRNLRADTSVADADLQAPGYKTSSESLRTQVPQPPTVDSGEHEFDYPSDGVQLCPEHHHLSGRKRSHSGPPTISHSSLLDVSSLPSIDLETPTLHSAPYPPSSFRHGHLVPAPSNVLFSEYAGSENNQHTLPTYDYPVTISQTILPRPFSAQPVPRAFYEGAAAFISPYRHSMPQQQMISTHPQHYASTPSPSELASFKSGQHDALISPPPLISGLPGVPCEKQDS